MKREYMAPAVEVLDCMMTEMIAVSGVGTDNGIGYGGVDEDGAIEPEARRLIDDFLLED